MTSLSTARFTALKSMLHGGCAALTCAAILGVSAPTPASAQVTGGIYDSIGSISTDSTTNTSQVRVDQSDTIIRWNPTGSGSGNYVSFLEAGNSLDFSASPAVNGNYTVLNQFVNGSGGDYGFPIGIDGAVTSSGNGNIWFQNGAGIYIGQTGSFDVGALVLTSRDIQHNLQNLSSTTTGSLYGANGEIQFGGTRTSTALNDGIVSNRGVINTKSNYVAIVAPNIVQDGIVTAAGSVAYVVAEAATIRINQGLFDINVTTGSGTDDRTLLTHRGQTLVNASNPNQNIYMVLIPKNDAVNMLVQGNIGFSADTATIGSNGSIILSAGRNIVGGQIDTTGPAQPNAGIILSAPTNGATRFNGQVTAHASGFVSADIASGTSLRFANDTNLTGDAGVNISVAGRLEMGDGTSSNPANLTLTSAGNASLGQVSLHANGGTVQLDGDLTLNGDRSQVMGSGTAITGSVVTLEASDNGQILSGANTQVTLSSNALEPSSGATGLAMNGGYIVVRASTGGLLDLNSINAMSNVDTFDSSVTQNNPASVDFIANGGTIRSNNISVSKSGFSSFTDFNAISFQASDGGRITSTGSITADTYAGVGFILSGATDNMISAQNNLSVEAGGSIVVNHSGRGAGTNSLSAGIVELRSTGQLTANAGSKIYGSETIRLNGQSGVDVGEVQSQGFTTLYAEAGDVLVDNLLSDGMVDVTGSSIDIASTVGLTFEYLNAHNGDANVRVADTLTLIGSAEAQGNISFTSADIEIDPSSGGIYAGFQDGTVRLINGKNANTTTIGGTQSGSGYHLSSEELGTIRADHIIVETPASASNAAPQVVVDDFDVFFGDVGRLSILSGGDISVRGNANVLGEGNRIAFDLTAARELRILLGQGSIRIGDRSGSSTPRGQLTMTAPRIIAATQAAINDLASATTQRQYEERLAQSDGFANSGYIIADQISANVDTGFFVQNSGDGDTVNERNGLVFGPGGLNINTSNANTLIVINGTRQTFNGTFAGADAITPYLDVYPGVTINGQRPSSSTNFNQLSLMNSCLIVDPTVCGAAALGPDTPTTPTVPEFPIQVIIGDPTSPDNEPEEEVIAEERESAQMPDSLISVSDIHPMTGEPLVIDPVTGAANDDLWTPTP